jgi:XTP/dITP diphosphohydrolase
MAIHHGTGSSSGPHRELCGRLIIATHNPGKFTEMRALIEPFGLEVNAASELNLREPEENGASFAANARLKALAAATTAGLPALADDSGLVVDALLGAPGIHSARWAGPDRDFEHAIAKVEAMLRERGALTSADRRARFVCALCLAWPDGHCEEFEGVVEGVLVSPPRGRKGFGYDPMFLPEGFAKTFGEMSGEEKQALPPTGRGLSHRARAFLKLSEACLERR